MKKYLILILVLFSMSFAGLLSPGINATLYTTHVLFEWEQEENATSYNIQLSQNSSWTVISVDTNTESLIYIDTEHIDWDEGWYWRARPVYSDNSMGDWILAHPDIPNSTDRYFNIASARSSATTTGNYQGEGITIFSSFFDYYSAAIDENGNEIWNSGDEELIYYNTDYYGQFFGAKLDDGAENYLPVVEYDLNNNIVWQEPADHFSHHDMIQLPNGNYMSIVEDIRLGPIPSDLDGGLSFLFMGLGYLANGFTDEFPWVGDKIVEWDQNGNEVWSWSTFDYYSMQDYDEIAGTWWTAFSEGRFDWTHANAFWFSEENNTIYFSSRHLSRITKIDYSTGDIIWNMGLDMPSGDVDCGQNIGFSFQHSLMTLQNGNIITLDNGNISETVNNTPYPTTRGIEIAIDETGNSCSSSLVWSYDLPEDLFGFASGNVQKLDTGNYLITTVGGGGTSLEVTPNNNVVWEASYNLSLPNGAVYRANRVSGLYPVAYSVIVEDMYLDGSNMIVDDGLNIRLYNNGTAREIFYIPLLNDSIDLEPGEISYLAMPIANNADVVEIEIIPEHRPDLTKNITVYINSLNTIIGCTDESACNYNENATEDDDSCIYDDEYYDCDGNCIFDDNEDGFVDYDCFGVCGGNAELDECGTCDGSGPDYICDDDSLVCDENDCSSNGECSTGFTYYELVDIPNSAVVLDESQCFSNTDLNILTDIITINDLDLEPLSLGTQNWFEGHVRRFLVGDYYDGGNVSLTDLPSSIGDLPEIAILYLNYNSLSELPDSICNLGNLVYLVLSFNNLTHLPDDIGNLSNLIWLDAGYNSLESIPSSIGSLSYMQYLWIFNNQLSSLPETICDLTVDWNGVDSNFLPYFGSGGNFLCDNLPECIENSENINTSIDPLYYSFMITIEQDCEETPECGSADVNDDGTVDVIDIVALVNLILSEQEFNDELLCSYDVNSDGTIDVIDIVVIINTILG